MAKNRRQPFVRGTGITSIPLCYSALRMHWRCSNHLLTPSSDNTWIYLLPLISTMSWFTPMEPWRSTDSMSRRSYMHSKKQE